MKNSAQIRLLKAQIDKIDNLERAENYDNYKSWHTQTELLLRDILGEKAGEVRDFHLLSGEHRAVINLNPDINAKRRTEAYFRNLKKCRSILIGVLDFLKIKKVNNTEAPISIGAQNLKNLHKNVKQKCSKLYTDGHYPEAVEKGFKVVRDRLRELTTYETGSEAFGKGNLYIKGASAENVDKDFQNAVKFLTMAIDQFRNEKSHTSDGNINDPVRAYEYLTLSSLAMRLLDNGEVRKKNEQPKRQNSDKVTTSSRQQTIALDTLQIFILRLFGSMTSLKELAIVRHMGGSIIHPLGSISNPELLKELNNIDSGELEANLDEMVSLGLLTHEYSSRGTPKYKLAKQGYDIIKQHPELSTGK
jgi:TIGR02391 family protein